MRHRHTLSIFLIVILGLIFNPVTAQQNMSFTPPSGPIGTTIFVDCGPNGTSATFANQEIRLDGNGFGSFVVPTAYAPGNYQINCLTLTSNTSFSLGTFELNECPLLNEHTLTGDSGRNFTTFSAQGGNPDANGSLTGENISVTGNDTYTYIADIDNGTGAQMRLIVRANDPTRLVNYINDATFDFRIYSGRPSEDLTNCTLDISMPFGEAPVNRIDEGAVDVELVLLSGQSILTDRNYLVYYSVNSSIEPQSSHTYHPENASAIAGRFANHDGFLNLSAWDMSQVTPYEDSVQTYNPRVLVPAIVAQAPQEVDYRMSVNNLVSNNATYSLVGTFQTIPCDSTGNACLGTQPEPQSVVLNRGVGISSGNPVYNGNFEVEAYCQQILPNSDVSHDEVNWYCSNDSGTRTQLTEQDFTQICRQTYNNPQAFAVRDLDLTTPDDSPNNIPAFNWRCLGPDPNA